ncbi:MAG: N-formylglutamate amidohydrolase [Aestuariivirga sp.]|uniref:N-formylglutamate amidohydrolase n=1 Tax=Aestuariivirga sp. TaxID=2650926 RepID=UPI0025BC7F4E|nr:N-formylglutamate amidohydrolase [Aestuariivirga sp.]MCA3562032.1 N-formylglutamate amidohydrolase [Aestuariivirga sp.]
MTKISPGEAYEIVAGEGRTGLILLCDHASSAVPPEYCGLGLAAAQLARHIAYDIGARDVTLGLAARLGAPAVLSRFSRLLIDPNRGLDDPTLIMRISDGAAVPGNREVDEAERQRRIARFHTPYHRAIAGTIRAAQARGLTPLIVSIHSFTPLWRGSPRPWHVSILWDRDEATARAMIAGFAAQRDLVVGDNEPYHGALEGDTLNTHGTLPGLPHALIEIRQDLIAAKTGVDEWVERLARVIDPIMNNLRRDPD